MVWKLWYIDLMLVLFALNYTFPSWNYTWRDTWYLLRKKCVERKYLKFRWCTDIYCEINIIYWEKFWRLVLIFAFYRNIMQSFCNTRIVDCLPFFHFIDFLCILFTPLRRTGLFLLSLSFVVFFYFISNETKLQFDYHSTDCK